MGMSRNARGHSPLDVAAAAVLLLAAPLPSSAAETVTYRYDALGRLISTQSAGSVNNNQAHSLCFDKADNRTRYKSTSNATFATCNQPPVAVADTFSFQCINGGQRYPLANDSDPEGNTLSLVSAQSNGGISITAVNTTTVAISVNGVPNGTYTGSYVVSDGQGNAVTGQITVIKSC